MGVQSLWDIVGPAARPVKLEALSRKKLAVDASIWIYQFLKAVRDKDGNALGQSHIVGFFRRICKLLYFGILPLFVFDGGAPPLKRQVVQKRRERRQGNSESIATTAQKLLAILVQRQAQETAKRRPRTPDRGQKATLGDAEPDLDAENVAYLDDMPLQHPNASQGAVLVDSSPEKRFIRRDEYHLPELKEFTVAKDDQRIMPESEFQEYGDNNSFDVVDGISIDSVDPSSAEFAELPMATQYMILSHLRLRSRLRLGYSKDQLEHLFPNSQDFSRFQIQQVQKRNFYTQRLMNVSGMGEESGNVTRRIAGEKDKQYTLVKNDDGWTLSLGGDDGEAIELDENGAVVEKAKAVSVKEPIVPVKAELVDDDDSDDLEDIPLGEENDDELDRAVIESIYDQYKGDYEETDVPIREVETFDEVELKEAIEQSKKDYAAVKHKEENLQRSIAAVGPQAEFNFGLSLLFGAASAQNDGKSDEQKEKKESESADIEKIIEEDEKEPEGTPSGFPRAVPSWFKDSSQVDRPHAQAAFLDDRPARQRKLDENEEAGIISWTEAQEMMKEDERDSDVEIVESQNDQSSPPAHENVEDPRESEIETHELDDKFQVQPHVTAASERNKVSGVAVHQQRSPSRRIKQLLVADLNKVAAGQKKVAAGQKKVAAGQKKVAAGQKKVAAGQKRTMEDVPAKSAKQAMVMDYDFIEEDDDGLLRQMREEEAQHREFASQIRVDQMPTHTKVSEEQLLQERLQKAKRDAEEVTQTMISDVQELLKRFGIPYITAPMEAEAQCAELYRLGLVDGIVTDDSDCFLFGGSKVYKNMFNQKQYVECYIAEDIQHKCGLDQTKLIELALLLGSDYTEGIKGVGPVLAMEILAEFGTLGNFKQWFDNHTKSQSGLPPANALEKTLLTRIKNGKLFLPDSFPDSIVIEAYRRPEVDSDDSEFRWGVPSLDQIRSYLMYNVRWSQEAVDEVMVPLIRSMNKRRAEGTQLTIGEFFPQELISYKKDVALGKRMKVAANKLKR